MRGSCWGPTVIPSASPARSGRRKLGAAASLTSRSLGAASGAGRLGAGARLWDRGIATRASRGASGDAGTMLPCTLQRQGLETLLRVDADPRLDAAPGPVDAQLP